jgi:hypothetical protein
MPTQNILAICDFDMRFTYVSVGQPGSMHDMSVLNNAKKVDDKFFPHRPKVIFSCSFICVTSHLFVNLQIM